MIAKIGSEVHIYVDSSALVKRALAETESRQLVETLEGFVRDGDRLFSSTLAWIESTRTIRSRLDASPPGEVVELVSVALSGVIEYFVTEQVANVARRMGPASLRSLDAIHLATATLVGADLVCAYDQRLLLSAQELGFRTISPGL
ncbi:MAG: type II toxin-antitoxin system VapC family toxin [Salinibacterium sp.]|nr:type II toxin-antitoxin system VapC family toxin [Cryobacterium sp.]MCB1280960.1 type II toxin-antitoxin system VapC family toxin [Salinibacterium sp.]